MDRNPVLSVIDKVKHYYYRLKSPLHFAFRFDPIRHLLIGRAKTSWQARYCKKDWIELLSDDSQSDSRLFRLYVDTYTGNEWLCDHKSSKLLHMNKPYAFPLNLT